MDVSCVVWKKMESWEMSDYIEILHGAAMMT